LRATHTEVSTTTMMTTTTTTRGTPRRVGCVRKENVICGMRLWERQRWSRRRIAFESSLLEQERRHWAVSDPVPSPELLLPVAEALAVRPRLRRRRRRDRGLSRRWRRGRGRSNGHSSVLARNLRGTRSACSLICGAMIVSTKGNVTTVFALSAPLHFWAVPA
jgi:hypothetical protein